MTEVEIVAAMQRYSKEIYRSAQLGHKPGASLANYTRMLRMLDELRGEEVEA